MSLSQKSSIPFSIVSSIRRPPSREARRRKRIRVDSMAKEVDCISNLPDDVLLLILKKISTEDAIKTSVLSKRWKNVWKHMTFLVFSKRNIFKFNMADLDHRSQIFSEMITKVINNLNGNLTNFGTPYISCHSEDSAWIRTLTHVKHTYRLSLVNPLGHCSKARKLHLLPNVFSTPPLAFLSLLHYDLDSAHAFGNYNHLCILKLVDVCAEIDVFNDVIASCPSLVVLVLKIMWPMFKRRGCLRIHNNNLKLLRLKCTYVTNIEVSANLLDIFSLEYPFATPDNVDLTIPRLESFNKFNWVFKMLPHLSYNISSDVKDIAHDFVVRGGNNYLKRYTSLEVSVDLMNPIEVEKLKDFLLAWNAKREELGIVFKRDSDPEKEGESFICGAPKKKWEEVLNADFRVNVVCLYNFTGSDEEFALVSRFVTQGAVVKHLKIDTTSVPAFKIPEMETAVEKLAQLPKGSKNLSIEYFHWG